MKILTAISNWFGKKRVQSAYYVGTNLLQTLADYPDQKGGETWDRMVSTFIQLISEFPDQLFLARERATSDLAGAKLTPYGYLIRLERNGDFPERLAFVGSIGTEPNKKYTVIVRLEANRERPNPVCTSSIEVKSAKSRIFSAASFYQHPGQIDESPSFLMENGVDKMLNRKDSINLDRAFLRLAGVSL